MGLFGVLFYWEIEMIKPTVGRVVWYWPHGSDHIYDSNKNPLAAIIAYVHSDTMVNLTISRPSGETFGKSSVSLIQHDVSKPEDGGFCEWMPYQLGQAEKTAAALAGNARASTLDITDGVVTGRVVLLDRIAEVRAETAACDAVMGQAVFVDRAAPGADTTVISEITANDVTVKVGEYGRVTVNGLTGNAYADAPDVKNSEAFNAWSESMVQK